VPKFPTPHLHATITIQQITRLPIIEDVDAIVEILGTTEDVELVREDADLTEVEETRDNSDSATTLVRQTGGATPTATTTTAPSVSTVENPVTGHTNVVPNLSIRQTWQINPIPTHTHTLQHHQNPLRNPRIPRANHAKPPLLSLISMRELVAMLGPLTPLMSKLWMTLFGKPHVRRSLIALNFSNWIMSLLLINLTKSLIPLLTPHSPILLLKYSILVVLAT